MCAGNLTHHMKRELKPLMNSKDLMELNTESKPSNVEGVLLTFTAATIMELNFSAI